MRTKLAMTWWMMSRKLETVSDSVHERTGSSGTLDQGLPSLRPPGRWVPELGRGRTLSAVDRLRDHRGGRSGRLDRHEHDTERAPTGSTAASVRPLVWCVDLVGQGGSAWMLELSSCLLS